MLESAEAREVADASDTHLDSSGHAPIAGVGDAEGDGEDRRKEGCCRWSVCGISISSIGLSSMPCGLRSGTSVRSVPPVRLYGS